jgi:hypothetical protein
VIVTTHFFGSVTTALLSLNFFYFVVAWCNTKLTKHTKLKGESVGMLPDMGSMYLFIMEVAGI